MLKNILHLTYLLVGLVCIVGCEAAGPIGVKDAIKPSESVGLEEFIMGASVEDRAIVGYRIGRGADVVLLIASIHGNEAVGTPLLHQLKSYLLTHPRVLVGRTVLLIPELNPDGVAKNIRFNARGIDLNRNYPASNRVNSKRYGASLSEPETRALYQLLKTYQPKRVVSIHQPVGVIDYDGPGKILAQRMSEVCDLPVRKLGTRPGSMGAYVGEELGIPIITVEFRRSASKEKIQTLWDSYRDMLLASIVYPMPLSAYQSAEKE